MLALTPRAAVAPRAISALTSVYRSFIHTGCVVTGGALISRVIFLRVLVVWARAPAPPCTTAHDCANGRGDDRDSDRDPGVSLNRGCYRA
jgi:hypothetical protein